MTSSIVLRLGINDARALITSLGLTNLMGQGVVMVGKGDELTPAEVADELGTSPSTVRRYEAKGWLIPRRMPGSRHRRYRRADVDEFKRKYESGELDQNDIRQPPGRETEAS